MGFGAAAEAHLAAYAAGGDATIVAVVDPSPGRRAAARALIPAAATFSSTEELADAEVPIDFLDVCSPPRWHAANITAGLEMGHHVMCEKPLLGRSDEYPAVLATLSRSAGVLFPCHNYKFSPAFRRMRASIASGTFGRVVSGEFRTLRTRHAAGAAEWRPDWRRDPEIAGGGIVQDHGTHSVYLSTHLTDGSAATVSCVTSRRLGGFAGTEDTAVLVVGLAHGAEIRIELTWAAPSRRTSYTVVGSRESVTLDGDRFIHTTPARTRVERVPSGFDEPVRRGWFGPMFEDFRRLIADPARQHELLTEAYETAVVIESAYESAARAGQTVAIGPRLLHGPRELAGAPGAGAAGARP